MLLTFDRIGALSSNVEIAGIRFVCVAENRCFSVGIAASPMLLQDFRVTLHIYYSVGCVQSSRREGTVEEVVFNQSGASFLFALPN